MNFNKMKIDKIALIFILVFIISLPIIIYSSWKEDHTCDTKVLMKDGTVYEATRKCHNNDGMTWLSLCDGTDISFPTNDIKKIEQINQ